MSTTDNDRLVRCTDQTQEADSSGVSRRKFLGGLGGAAAAAMTSGVLGAAVLEPAAKAAVGTDLAAEACAHARRLRRKSCRDVRKDMADYWFNKGTVAAPDQRRRGPLSAAGSATTPRACRTTPSARSTRTPTTACSRPSQSGKPADYDAMILAPAPAS